MKKKVFIYKPLSIMGEGEKGFVPSAAVIILYQDGKYGYRINLMASYSPKEDYNNRIQISKSEGKYVVEDFISANLIYYPQIQHLEGLHLTEFTEIEPIFYQSPEYVDAASFELLHTEFAGLLENPDEITKDYDYFKLIVNGLKQEDRILSFYKAKSFLEIVTIYYDLIDAIDEIDQSVKDVWTVEEKKVYRTWIKYLYGLIESRIESEWKTLSAERQEELTSKFKSSDLFDWLTKVSNAK